MCLSYVIVQITFRYTDLQNVIVSPITVAYILIFFLIRIRYHIQSWCNFDILWIIFMQLHQTVILQHFILYICDAKREKTCQASNNYSNPKITRRPNNGEMYHFCQVHADLDLVSNILCNKIANLLNLRGFLSFFISEAYVTSA